MIPSKPAKQHTPEAPREKWSKANGDIPVVCTRSTSTKPTMEPEHIAIFIQSNKGKRATITTKRHDTKIPVDLPVELGPQHIIMARSGTITNVELVKS